MPNIEYRTRIPKRLPLLFDIRHSVYGIRHSVFRLVHIHRFRRKYHNIKPLKPSMMPTSHQN